VLEGYCLTVLEGYCLRPGTLAYGHTLSKECCLHSGRSRADALIEACASAGADPAHWRSTMLDGRARIADRKCRAGRRAEYSRNAEYVERLAGAVEVVDPREYKKLQCCKNLFTRYSNSLYKD
jgi:hypothetical protein